MCSVKSYFSDVINEKRKGLGASFFKDLFIITSYFYAGLIQCHSFLYESGILKSYRVPVNVISVGNITLGGTGKTPFVIMLSKLLLKKGMKLAILIRGYGEDEHILLDEKLKPYGTRVYVGRDRIKTAKEALSYGANTIVLDDGFQHRRLKRDIDIVLIDSTNPFGNGHLFPGGILREPVKSLKRASFIVLTKIDKAGRNLDKTEKSLRKLLPKTPILHALHKAFSLLDIAQNKEVSLDALKGKKVFILSAICDPGYFKYTVSQIGVDIVREFIFQDHYNYKEKDIENILKEAKALNIDTVITTEKDLVKLKTLLSEKSEDLNFLVLKIKLEIVKGQEELDARLHLRDFNKTC